MRNTLEQKQNTVVRMESFVVWKENVWRANGQHVIHVNCDQLANSVDDLNILTSIIWTLCFSIHIVYVFVRFSFIFIVEMWYFQYQHVKNRKCSESEEIFWFGKKKQQQQLKYGAQWNDHDEKLRSEWANWNVRLDQKSVRLKNNVQNESAWEMQTNKNKK